MGKIGLEMVSRDKYGIHVQKDFEERGGGITDLGSLSYKFFLTYLYNTASGDRLRPVQALCEERLCTSTDINNAVAHLVLGDMYQVQ